MLKINLNVADFTLQHPPGLQHLRYRVFQMKNCTHTQTERHYVERHLCHVRVAYLKKHKDCASIGERHDILSALLKI